MTGSRIIKPPNRTYPARTTQHATEHARSTHAARAEHAMTFVQTLEPRTLWGHFDRILEIPRGSKQEDRIRTYVLEVAERNGLEHAADGAGNVVVRKPATPGCQDGEITVLQSHLDMVNEKNAEVAHDFTRDPIRPAHDGDYLTATGTTLGADNGIGVAAMLAMMEADDIAHGPLELLFTVDEETGLTGAGQLDGSMIRGRRLINLDTEEAGTIYVGCAGGGDSQIVVPLTRTDRPRHAVGLQLVLRGLRGGHSGVDIHLQRGNAIRTLARIVDAAAQGLALHLVDFHGGNMRNAIPREATAIIVLPEAEVPGFRRRAMAEFTAVQATLAATDPDLSLAVVDAEVPKRVVDVRSAWRVIHLLQALPHGVAAMSLDIPGLVETSSNLAVVALEGDQLHAITNTRSSVASELEALRSRIRAIAHLAGAQVEQPEAYPGWKPDLASPLLAAVRAVYQEELGRPPEIKAVHAGLETGIIGQKVPGMDMVSIGPEIDFPHSPDERVSIPSVAEFYGLLVRVLERLSR
jgi:dipeptidase D